MRKYIKLMGLTMGIILGLSATLWKEENNIYSKKGIYKVGDTLKIVFDENTLIQYRASTSDNGKITANSSKANGNLINFLPALGGNDSYQISKKSSTKSSRVFKNKLTVQITKILKNGNLQISGQHNILINNERESLTISGIVNPSDIKNKKYIYSTDIINPTISYKNYLIQNNIISKKDYVQTYTTNISVVSGVTQRNITVNYEISKNKKNQLILQYLNKILSILFSK